MPWKISLKHLNPPENKELLEEPEGHVKNENFQEATTGWIWENLVIVMGYHP